LATWNPGEISPDVDPKYSSIDQIFVLRKSSKRKSENLPIYEDVIWDLFQYVRNHINSSWSNVQKKLETGKMI
jgi:hypothetical protein